MLKKSSWWLLILVCVVAVGFLITGCAKKTMVKEEAAARPAPAVEAKQEAPAPAPVAPPKEEAPAPPPAPKVEAAPPAAPEPIDLVDLRLQFAFDDYSLSSKSKENLEKLAGWMKKTEDAKIQIEGHTCDIGTNEYNLALGERRASSAKTYLEGLGVTSSRISTISYGEERPLVPNSDEANRSKNRRDEFVTAK
ncbi:MAG TPA: OmpA family protein [Thermodesulfobacteriota bacterium]|nr:OmpA family protein [Thermodesulfobacteriota bacterium]